MSGHKRSERRTGTAGRYLARTGQRRGADSAERGLDGATSPRRRAARRAPATRETYGIQPERGRRSVAADAPRPPQAESRETILLVEDEPAVRQLFAQALTRAGYRVYEARNGQEALKVFDQHGDAIDLLLTDLRMPYMGGAELARQLRARRLSLKLLCISGYPRNIDSELTFDFLAKPFSRDDLLAKVREVLDRR